MIPIENQVCTLKQAKIFKNKFGLELDSYFVWSDIYKDPPKTTGPEYPAYVENWRLVVANNCKGIPAPSCAELGVLLPGMIPLEGDSVPAILTLYKSSLNGSFTFEYYEDAKDAEYLATSREGYEAHAKADLLIHLLKEKVIKPEDLKL